MRRWPGTTYADVLMMTPATIRKLLESGESSVAEFTTMTEYNRWRARMMS